ncbi:uncharacterized protein BCR38DRAFT_438236 [Pseudomassariella vexata]|uniref:Uncharacterized protein n=1 Tax=Pseudomassariella vexata TaxID=1141098 RepID=A0A1Y2DSW0_9PEZI|nr:uncharacterized protein BCR38DRAFT_438236 [Pseudomassariella vexata]ORY62350.1 hypothetical protein BCR38DRAFT_438236 [Pseudomassariella vexata]
MPNISSSISFTPKKLSNAATCSDSVLKTARTSVLAPRFSLTSRLPTCASIDFLFAQRLFTFIMPFSSLAHLLRPAQELHQQHRIRLPVPGTRPSPPIHHIPVYRHELEFQKTTEGVPFLDTTVAVLVNLQLALLAAVRLRRNPVPYQPGFLAAKIPAHESRPRGMGMVAPSPPKTTST